MSRISRDANANPRYAVIVERMEPHAILRIEYFKNVEKAVDRQKMLEAQYSNQEDYRQFHIEVWDAFLDEEVL